MVKSGRTFAEVFNEALGFATDDELCNIAARALQGLKDRGYKVSASEAIAPPGTPPSKPAHAFVVTIAKTFRSDDTK